MFFFYLCYLFFFFFKQKTAYEMRISDWSSDVCSSDLRRLRPAIEFGRHDLVRDIADDRGLSAVQMGLRLGSGHACHYRGRTPRLCRSQHRSGRPRSEEHTSELKSLMRISYAVFCLNKKRTMLNRLTTHTHALHSHNTSEQPI